VWWNATRSNLLFIMLGVAAVSVLLAGLGSWGLLGRALSPLATITESVDQINAQTIFAAHPLSG